MTALNRVTPGLIPTEVGTIYLPINQRGGSSVPEGYLILDGTVPSSVQHHIFPISNYQQIYSDYSHVSKLQSLRKQTTNTYPLN